MFNVSCCNHGYFLGPTDKLEVPSTTIGPLAQFVDSIMLTRGILRTSVNPALDVPIVLRVSGGSTIIGEDVLMKKLRLQLKKRFELMPLV